MRLDTGRPIGNLSAGNSFYRSLRSSPSDPDRLEIPYKPEDLKQPEHHANHHDDIKDF
jgi:hypothetical protein